MKKQYFIYGVFFLVTLLWSPNLFSRELSADMITMEKGKMGSGKFFSKDGKSRIELIGQKGYTIIREDRDLIWIVDPEERQYIEIPMVPEERQRFGGGDRDEVRRSLVGSEMIDGHPTMKYEVIQKEFDGTGIIKTYQWVEREMDFVMKELSGDGSWSVEYIHIKQFEPVSDALFEIPADYRRIPINIMNGSMGGSLD